jgi:hypothetical protein|tara:strand:- start:234 stop:455 length:222 start_codon:yes stop_codon:yes gene_type:complete
MKQKLEKQILEWQQELSKQKQTREQANQVFNESNKNIERLEGGILFGQAQIKLLEQEEEKTGTVELGVKKEKK